MTHFGTYIVTVFSGTCICTYCMALMLRKNENTEVAHSITSPFYMIRCINPFSATAAIGYFKTNP